MRRVKDRVKKVGSMDITFFVLVTILLTFGLVMLFSASYAYSYYHYNGDSFRLIKKQLLFAVMGIIGMLIISKLIITSEKICVLDFWWIILFVDFSFDYTSRR